VASIGSRSATPMVPCRYSQNFYGTLAVDSMHFSSRTCALRRRLSYFDTAARNLGNEGDDARAHSQRFCHANHRNRVKPRKETRRCYSVQHVPFDAKRVRSYEFEFRAGGNRLGCKLRLDDGSRFADNARNRAIHLQSRPSGCGSIGGDETPRANARSCE
jgi:hypothetical protein